MKELQFASLALLHDSHVAFSLASCLPRTVYFCMAILRFRPVDPRISGFGPSIPRNSGFGLSIPQNSDFGPSDFRISEIPNTVAVLRIRSHSSEYGPLNTVAVLRIRSSEYGCSPPNMVAILRIQSSEYGRSPPNTVRTPNSYPQKYKS
jgi:hypothetical protein